MQRHREREEIQSFQVFDEKNNPVRQAIAADSLPHSSRDVVYPPSEIPMSVRDWIVAGAIVAAVLALLPTAWGRVEAPPAGTDYRIPYALGNDYWLFERFSRLAADEGRTLLVGDSVIWGHYVPPEGSLSAQLNRQCGRERFANLGVDGIHPAALEGLIEHYGSALAGRDVVLHCNLLWMSSPRHDLQEHKEFAFNHPRLVPQFRPWIPCYNEPLSGRVEIAAARLIPFAHWTNHLRQAYLGGADLPAWTLKHPYENPLSGAAMTAIQNCAAPSDATEETWTQRGAEMTPRWVDLDTSIQWAAFRRAVERLRQRGSRVFVVIGPLNEHMLKGEALEGYRARVAEVGDWLRREGIAHVAPAVLPGDQYANASHPLRAGYDTLARELLAKEAFKAFLAGAPSR